MKAISFYNKSFNISNEFVFCVWVRFITSGYTPVPVLLVFFPDSLGVPHEHKPFCVSPSISIEITTNILHNDHIIVILKKHKLSTTTQQSQMFTLLLTPVLIQLQQDVSCTDHSRR